VETTLKYAFIDESGTVGASTGTRFLVVAALVVVNPRDLEVPVRRALKKTGRDLTTGEIKASRASGKNNLRMLHAVANHAAGIVAVIIDQKAISIPPANPEEIYRQAVTRAIHILLENFQRVDICLDKRYSNAEFRDKLEQHIREDIMDVHPQMALIRQQSSYERKELQAVDAVAWAFFQKYERGDARFYDAIALKVIAEEVITKRKRSDKKNEFPLAGELGSGSPWAPISFCPVSISGKAVLFYEQPGSPGFTIPLAFIFTAVDIILQVLFFPLQEIDAHAQPGPEIRHPGCPAEFRTPAAGRGGGRVVEHARLPQR